MKTPELVRPRERNSGAIPVELSEVELIEAVRRLSPGRRAELLDKLEALRQPVVRAVPASRLYDLTDLVSLGGDAVVDAEALYDDNGGH